MDEIWNVRPVRICNDYFLIFAQAAGKHQGTGPMPPDVVRGFSGHWYVRLTGGAVALR
jgi:hypothetical protein